MIATFSEFPGSRRWSVVWITNKIESSVLCIVVDILRIFCLHLSITFQVILYTNKCLIKSNPFDRGNE